MAKGHVLHVVAAGEIGGAERMLVDLIGARSSTTEGRTCSVALFTPNEKLRALLHEERIEIDDRGSGVREGPWPFLKSTLGSQDVAWLERVIATRDARIVHLHTFASQVLGTRAAIAAGARVVRTEHSTRVYDDPSCWPFSRWSLARADAVVCISEHVKRRALSKSPRLAGKVTTIHNGVDVSRFAPVAPPAEAGPVRFLSLGRLDERKGLDLALRALREVPNAALDVVGDGDERRSLEALAAELGLRDRVTFHGYLADVRGAIARADVVLSSAREEGLGIALLEAMAMERPAVGVPVGGVVEIIEEGETGWLADVRTVSALSRVMQKAIAAGSVERMRRGKRARGRVLDRFSRASMRSAYEAVYASLSP